MTIADPVTVRSMNFAVDGYVLNGASAITLTNTGSGGPAGATIRVASAGGTATIAAPITSSVAASIIGDGTLVLEGANAFADYLIIEGGDLVLSGNSTTSVGTRVRVGWNGITGAAGRLTVTDSASLNTAYLFAGDAAGVSGEIVQTGGTVTVSNRVGVGHYPNETATYTMSGGSLILTGSSTTNPFVTSVSAEQSGTLYLGIDGTGVFKQSGGSVTAQGLVLDNRGDTAGTDTYTLTGGAITLGEWGIQGNASTQINLGGGTVAASADWSSSLPMTLTGTNGLTTIDTNGHAITLAGPLTGGGGLLKVDTGTLVLTGTNTYTGETRIDGGTLTLRGTGAITATNLLRNRAGGVILNIEDDATIVAGSIIFGDQSNASITINQSGGSVTSTGTTNNPAGNSVSNRWGHWPNSTTVYNLSDGALNLLGAPLYLSWDGPATLNVQGGTANIVGINMGYDTRSYASTVNLTSGQLNIGAAGIVTGGTSNKSINLGGGTLGALADWSSGRPMTLTGIGGNTTVDTNGYTVTLSGALTGSGGFAKDGDGTLVLSGASSYAGPTAVTNGTLLVNGSISSDVAINGGVLGGTGTIGGTVTVASGGTYAPGASVGQQTAGGAVWQGGGHFVFEVNDAAGTAGGPDGWDLLTITDGTGAGTLDLSGLSASNPFYIDIVSLAGTVSGDAANLIVTEPVEWEFVTYEEMVGEFSSDLFVLDASGFTNDLGAGHFGIVQSASGLAIAFVPEPGALLMCVIAVLLLMVRRKR